MYLSDQFVELMVKCVFKKNYDKFLLVISFLLNEDKCLRNLKGKNFFRAFLITLLFESIYSLNGLN